MPAETTKLTGVVAKLLNERELVINIGAEQGVREGMRFSVKEPKSVILDPVTNSELGHLQREKVRVKVVDVHPKFAVARTYETYQTVPELAESDPWTGLAAMRERMLARQRVETKVRTLRRDDLPGFGGIDASSSYVEIGDPVELIVEARASTPATQSPQQKAG